ncbi:hypothetical protein TNCT_406771 [Trichonephila clavata]|uniref:Uncharacterized protein n=1 Tax=Trichonephila clavata TaxID=2740835 RepID=A0A8X6FD88_TRICU|nr:hypothetical protein TNCT_406771 [Trichonephila clavata]
MLWGDIVTRFSPLKPPIFPDYFSVIRPGTGSGDLAVAWRSLLGEQSDAHHLRKICGRSNPALHPSRASAFPSNGVKRETIDCFTFSRSLPEKSG